MVEATGAAPLWPCGCVMGDPACRCGADPGVPAVDPAEAEQTLRDYAAEPDDYATEPGELAYAAETVLAALDAARAELAEMEDLAANLGAERLDALAEVERLRAQRGAALALHCPDEIGGRPACGHCSMAGLDGAGVPVGPVLIVGWPCPTAETLGVTE